MTGWKWLISDINGLPHRVPDDPAVIATHVARGFELTDLPGDLNPDDEEFVAALAVRQAGKDAEELRGKALDEALEQAGLSKSGTVDEKRQRLAESQAASTNDGEQPEGNE
jgi:hypothetical protein